MAGSLDIKKEKKRIIRWSIIFIIVVPVILAVAYFIMMAFDIKKEL